MVQPLLKSFHFLVDSQFLGSKVVHLVANHEGEVVVFLAHAYTLAVWREHQRLLRQLLKLTKLIFVVLQQHFVFKLSKF